MRTLLYSYVLACDWATEGYILGTDPVNVCSLQLFSISSHAIMMDATWYTVPHKNLAVITIFKHGRANKGYHLGSNFKFIFVFVLYNKFFCRSSNM